MVDLASPVDSITESNRNIFMLGPPSARPGDSPYTPLKPLMRSLASAVNALSSGLTLAGFGNLRIPIGGAKDHETTQHL